MIFQTLDDKNECVGIYAEGKLSFDELPDGLTACWAPVPYLENKEIEIFNDVVFVALKNGEHNGRGFLFAEGAIEKDFEHLQTIKITQIKDKIKNFFVK